VKKRAQSFEPRYKVIDRKTGIEVRRVFILRPVKDAAARMALRTYAQETPDQAMREFIRLWLEELESEPAK